MRLDRITTDPELGDEDIAHALGLAGTMLDDAVIDLPKGKG